MSDKLETLLFKGYSELPEGLYQFKVLEITREVSVGFETESWKVKLGTTSAKDSSWRVAWDRIPGQFNRKIGQFLGSLGYDVKDQETTDLGDKQLVGKSGYLLSEKDKRNDTKTYTDFRYL